MAALPPPPHPRGEGPPAWTQTPIAYPAEYETWVDLQQGAVRVRFRQHRVDPVTSGLDLPIALLKDIVGTLLKLEAQAASQRRIKRN